MKKKILIGSVFLIILLTAISVNAIWEDKIYNEETKTITIRNWLNFPIVDLQLLYNTEGCGICYAIINITPYANFEAKDLAKYKFSFFDKEKKDAIKIGSLKSWDLKKQSIEDYQVEIYDYGDCININGTLDKCKIGSHYEIRQREVWKKFILTPATFKKAESVIIKLEGRKEPDASVEWIPTFYGLELEEWAWWTPITTWFSDNCTDNVTEWVKGYAGKTEPFMVVDTTWFSSVADGWPSGYYDLTAGHTYSNFTLTTNWSINYKTRGDYQGAAYWRENRFGMHETADTMADPAAGTGSQVLYFTFDAPDDLMITVNGTTYWIDDLSSIANELTLDICYNCSGDAKFIVLVNGNPTTPSTNNPINIPFFNVKYLGGWTRKFSASVGGFDWWVISDNIIAPPSDTTPPDIMLISPADNSYNDSLEINFTAIASDIESGFTNCSLWHNETGTFVMEVDNGTSIITNNTAFTLTDTFSAMGDYIWNIECCDDATTPNCAFNSTNRTLYLQSVPPTVTLDSPADNSYNDSIKINFTCSATAGTNNLANISLYGNFSGSWNWSESRDLIGTSNSTTFNKTLIPDSYEWNCLAYDSAGLSDWGNANFTININSLLNVSLYSPVDELTTNNVSLNFSSDIKVVNYELKNATLYIWYPNGSLRSINSTTLSGTTNTTVSSVVPDLILYENYNWNYYGCAQKLQYGSAECKWATDNRTFSILTEIDGEGWENSTYETKNSTFQINITLPNSATLFGAKLNYNGTNYTVADVSVSGSSYVLIKTIDIPIVTNEKYHMTNTTQFFWHFTYAGTVGFSEETTTVREQKVSSILLNYCNATWNIPYINFTLLDEEGVHERLEGVNITVNNTWATAWKFWLGSGSIYKTYNTFNTSTNSSDIDFCAFPSNLSYTTNLIMEYDNDDYSPREYYLNDAVLTNVTSEINLYLLKADEAVKFFFNLKTGYDVIANAYMTIGKYIVGDGTYLTIGIRKTDVDGNFVEYMDLDKNYRFTVVKDGVVLGILDIVSKCEEAPCEIDLNIEEAIGTIWSGYYAIYAEDVVYNLTYNSTSKIVIYIFVDTSGLAEYGRLKVDLMKYNESALTVCDTQTYSVVGTLTCNLSAYTDGQFKAIAYISRSPEKIVEVLGIVIAKLKEIFGVHGLMIAMFLTITLAFVGFYNPVVGIVLILVALFASLLTGFIALSIPTLFLLITIGIILIIKMRT